jgi:pyridinium-3,5-biscarboxylic acid mononucleotide synthase
MKHLDLKHLTQRLLAGEISLEDFLKQAAIDKTADLGETQVDLDRSRRCGFPEVVFAEGKTVAMMEKIFLTLSQQGTDVLATRMSAEQAESLLPKFPSAHYNPIGRTFRIPKKQAELAQRAGASSPPAGDLTKFNTPPEKTCGAGVSPALAAGTAAPQRQGINTIHQGRVAIVTAGTSDLPVAEEARETALWTGAKVTMIHDVGVAGPHRLRENLPLLEDADAVVVVAGMEGALPSVVGGYVACPVIAVPTSVGYGASFGGVAALLGMLNSCAANVSVVNIDAGFKGGYVAGLIAKNAAKARGEGRGVRGEE